jgi:hypothetical protein
MSYMDMSFLATLPTLGGHGRNHLQKDERSALEAPLDGHPQQSSAQGASQRCQAAVLRQASERQLPAARIRVWASPRHSCRCGPCGPRKVIPLAR